MDEEEDNRRLETPRRSRSRTEQSRSRGRESVRRSRSHSRRELERELTLRQELDVLAQRDRDEKQRRLRSVQGSSRSRSRRSSRSRSRLKDDSRRKKSAKHSVERSRSPSFSTKDIVQIIKTIKNVLPPQPSTQTTQFYKGLDSKNIIPEFNPSEKNQRMDIWLKKVNECAEVYGWDERTIVHFAMQKLCGLAKTWYESLSTILYTWEEWQVKLMTAFPCEQNYAQILEDMLTRKSKLNEPIEKYFYEKLSLINQCQISGRRAVDCLIHGISDRTMRASALALRCDEPDQLLKFFLSTSKEVYTLSTSTSGNNPHAVEVRSNNKPNTKINASLFCYNCKERGHPFSKCPKPIIKCSYCNKVGHQAELCRSKQDSGAKKIDFAAKTMRISSSKPCSKFIKEVRAEGVLLEAFVDLGSEVTLIKQSSFARLGCDHDHNPSTMKGFGNYLVRSLGSATLNLSIDGVDATVSCRVVEDYLLEKPMLIGQSYSEQPHIVVYKDVNSLQFLNIGVEVPNPIEDDDEQLLKIRVKAFSKLYGVASVRVETETPFDGSIVVDTRIVGKPGEKYVVGGGVYEVKNGSVYVTITPCSAPCCLQENLVLSRVERVEMVYRLVGMEGSLIPTTTLYKTPVKELDETQVHVGELVSAADKARLLELLQRHEQCFAHDLAGLGCTNVTEMKIELNSQRPVIYRPYRLSHHEREKVREMVDEMLRAGIIRESTSCYASPIILVRKKNGSIRLCVDYRLLNSITVKERYPIPIIEDEIARLAGQAWFVTLDLMSGYYQVPIAEKSKNLTAFVTPDGQYEFNRMPFGLANAPAVFQRMMNHVLGSARFNKATVYIDDLLIYGKSSAECMERLEEVFELLEKANLKLNLSKCSFLQNKIDYLGYEISASGIRPGLTKIQSVIDFPKPMNIHGVRQFLGLVSYFRKFIQSFAQLAHPLTKLLKKSAEWEWGTEQDNSFKTLKMKLVDRPVLALYDPTAETELHTDASKIGVGGILLQRPQGSTGSFHPVAYYSRQTSPEEKNFHSYELETLAVICALKKFRVYLLGKTFKVVTDCSALRSTFMKRDLIPRIARWWLALQEFECSIEYRAGTKMGHVDALSRNPVYDAETSDLVQYPTVLVLTEEDWLLTLQLGDSELCRIRNIISSDLDSKGLEYLKENYILKNNKLYRCIGGNKECIRWVVPKGARWQLCKMNHDDIGHVGFEKTLERIKRNYWFAKMTRFVKKYVNACIDCALAKKTSNAREGFLHPIEKVAIPFHTLHIDHLGPFVKSKRGFTHILTVVDSFTKFVFIKPVRNTKTQNVIKVLQEIFDNFRVPDRVVSDRGSCFTSHAFRKFCLDHGIKHILNAVASPRSNGQVERYNRTILDSLTAQNIRDNEKEWDNKLGKIQWGLNNTIQKTIGKTPAEVMFGTAMNSEINPALNTIVEETRKDSDLTSLRAEVKQRIDKAQKVQKQYYDNGKRPARIYRKGDLVKITKVAFQNNGKSTKLMPSYEGPLRVVDVLGNDRYKVASIEGFTNMKSKRQTIVAADRIKPWIHVSSLGLDDGDGSDDTDNDTDDEHAP